LHHGQRIARLLSFFDKNHASFDWTPGFFHESKRALAVLPSRFVYLFIKEFFRPLVAGALTKLRPWWGALSTGAFLPEIALTQSRKVKVVFMLPALHDNF